MEAPDDSQTVENTENQDSLAPGERLFSVNKAGAVRPKKYVSKYSIKKRKVDRSDISGDRSNMKDSSKQYVEKNGGRSGDAIFTADVEEIDNSEACEDLVGVNVGVNYGSDYSELNDNSENSHAQVVSDEEETEKSTTGERIENPEITLINFLKQQEEIQLEDLMQEVQLHDAFNSEEESNEELNEEASEEDESYEESEQKPIYPGHSLPVKTSVLLIWLFVITHSLNASQVSDLLTLLSLHMISSYPALKSLYRFKRFFQHMKSSFVKHYYCAFCYTPVTEEQSTCPNTVCQKNLKDSSNKEYFLELPLKTQLTEFFSRDDFKNGLLHRKHRVKRQQNNIEDVYDSNCYKSMSDSNGPLNTNNENNLSFTFHTDGIPVFKSSKISIWPIFLMVNELPYRMRKCRENMLLCGLWFGSKKPMMNLFCTPLYDSLIQLEKGMMIKPQGKDDNILVHGYLYCITCDTPARASVLNMNQHNGEYCCPKCLQPGQNTRTAKGGNIRTFEFDQNDPLGPCRDGSGMKQNAQEAVNTGKTTNGIKGPSVLMFCPKFNTPKNIGIDYMHLVFLGIVRLLMKLWFDVSHSLQMFSLYQYLTVVDNRLEKLKPSHFITRTPRSISENLKFWKAAELRSWFFYYSIPCVVDLMLPKYLYHYCAFVEAIFLLTQSSISETDIQKSEQLLKYFVFMLPSLYGQRYMTINVHSLLHLPQTVRDLGPLWSFSCFPFESASGDILKLFHGTQHVDIQIINAAHIFQTLSNLAQTVSPTSSAYPLIQSLLKRSSHSRNDFQLYGKCYEKNLDESMKKLLCEFFSRPVEVSFHRRAIIRGVMYHSEDYTRSVYRNSHTVKFLDQRGITQYGSVLWFANVKCGEQSVECACISVFKERDVDLFDVNHEGVAPDQYIKANFMALKVPHIHFVEYPRTGTNCVVPIRQILDLCLYLQTDQYTVLCEEPNHCEQNL